MALIAVEEALARLLADARPLASEFVALEDVEPGRVLAVDLAATRTQPPFDAAAMDGYAVRAADIAPVPARLLVVGEAAAGRGFGGRVEPGTAARIFTGAPLPEGADTIVIQEDTEREGDHVTVREGSAAGRHIRPRGSDFTAGQQLLARGTQLGARDIMLAAAMGHASVPVTRRPSVAILATGDELVPPGQATGPDQIVCSNSYGIAALVRAAGGAPRILGIAGDSETSLSTFLDGALGADILVTTGGASVGDHDIVAPVLQARGMTLDFWKIAMRPGKPLLSGRLGAQRVLGLPGNPVSALICARVFLFPLLQALCGAAPAPGHLRTARTLVPLDANGPRKHFMRATSHLDAGGLLHVTPAASQDSSLMATLARSDCLIVREIAAPAVPAGGEVGILPLDL